MKVAVLGARGQLGAELCRQIGADAIALSRPGLDITDFAVVAKQMRDLRPQAVVNAAAYTQVDRAEQEPSLCFRVNAEAVQNLARVCAELECVLVQISSDYVFGAEQKRRTPYSESDPPGPLSVYGRSKREGERAAQEWARHFIVRTCGLYTRPEGVPRRGRNFVETMLVLAAAGASLRIVQDQFCTPTFTPHVARAIRFLLTTEAFGLYHVTNGGATNWHEFATAIFRFAGLKPEIHPISSEQYAAPAPRPRYSVLSTAKYATLGGAPLPGWEEALEEYFDFPRRAGSYAPGS